MQPNVKYLRTAQLFEENYKAHSDDNKGQFKTVWDMVKTIDKDARVKEVKAMKKASETIELNSARREYKGVLNMTEQYALLPDRYVNLTAITYENLTRVLKLVARVVKYYEGDIEGKLEGVSTIYIDGMSPHRYNNLLEDKCKALATALPAITKEVELTDEAVLLYADKMSVANKTAMLERLLHDLGYSMQDVA